MIEARSIDGGAQIPVDKLLLHKALLAFYPLHEARTLKDLTEKWIVWFREKDGRYKWKFWDIPITAIKDYFGEKVAMYFTYLTHYTKWLLIPAVAGAAAQLWIAAELDINGQAVLPFTVVVAVWTVVYLENFKRHQCMKQVL